MFGLRQKLLFGFGGLLAILLAVSGLGIAVLTQYRGALDKFYYENWRSVVYGQNMVDALDRLRETAVPLSGATGEPSLATLTAARGAADGLIARFDKNYQDENNNITLPGEREIASDLTVAWAGDDLNGRHKTDDCLRIAYLTLLDAHTTGAAHPGICRGAATLAARQGQGTGGHRPEFPEHAAHQRPGQGDGRRRHPADGAAGGGGRGAGGAVHDGRQPRHPPAAGHAHQILPRDRAGKSRPGRAGQIARSIASAGGGIQFDGGQAARVPPHRSRQAGTHAAHHPAGRQQPARRHRHREPRWPGGTVQPDRATAVSTDAGQDDSRFHRAPADRTLPPGDARGQSQHPARLRVGHRSVRLRWTAQVFPAARDSHYGRRPPPSGRHAGSGRRDEPAPAR